MHAFEHIDSDGGTNKFFFCSMTTSLTFSLSDGYIVLNEFLSLKSNKTMPDEWNLFVQPNREAGRLHFRLMDTAQQGIVAWSDFVRLYGCKLIVTRNRVSDVFNCSFSRDVRRSDWTGEQIDRERVSRGQNLVCQRSTTKHRSWIAWLHNKDLFSSCLRWLADDVEVRIATSRIQSKKWTNVAVSLETSTATTLLTSSWATSIASSDCQSKARI